MLASGMAKMVLAATTSSMRSPPPPDSQTPALLRSSSASAWMETRPLPTPMVTVSDSPNSTSQGAASYGPQPAPLGLTEASYTQCTDAYPRLLRKASDPGLPTGDPSSPAPSEEAEDFPPYLIPLTGGTLSSSMQGTRREPHRSRPVLHTLLPPTHRDNPTAGILASSTGRQVRPLMPRQLALQPLPIQGTRECNPPHRHSPLQGARYNPPKCSLINRP